MLTSSRRALGSACSLATALAAVATAPAGATAPVDPRVVERLTLEGQADYLVHFAGRADLRPAARLASKRAKGRFVVERLRAVADAEQRDVLRLLRSRGIEHRRLWIANALWVESDRTVLEEIVGRAEVDRVAANPRIATDLPAPATEGDCPTGGIASGVAQLGAPGLWDLGFAGQGVVVAGADTGYDWDHEALRAAYRGWDGATSSHDHNWHDAVHSSTGPCGADSPEPCDDSGHGTHTMGTMVGESPTDQLGVAPEARWIGCRNMDSGAGTPARYAECFQFFLAPTALHGGDPRPELAPDVINNSWSCPPSEGCTDPSVLLDSVAAVRAAGIVVVVAAGNGGSGCSSVSTPAAIYDESFTVGSVNGDDLVAVSSSRGPVTVDGSGRLKPDVSARGVGVCSTLPGDGYGVTSGTSMAAPHVAGLTALLISARPCLRGEVATLEALIEGSAVPRTTAQSCGGVPGDEVPNNTYGWGSVRAAVPPVEACRSAIFLDGFESGDTAGWNQTVP